MEVSYIFYESLNTRNDVFAQRVSYTNLFSPSDVYISLSLGSIATRMNR
jgi:hypothetical protein